MIVPSIDLMGGQTVQLVGGEKKALDAGDPRPFARQFGRVGEIAVVDLDAALGRGSNASLMAELLPIARCRVGGGIRDVATARKWLDRGATRVVLGTAARPDILSQLPPSRIIAALDAKHGEVVVEGWQTGTGATVHARMQELRDLVSGFLVTFVEREGRLAGIDLEAVKSLKEAAGTRELTVAGGVTTAADVAALAAMGVHAQVGMALYTGRFDCADAVGAILKSDRPDGLWPTVVVDEAGHALGLCYSNLASLREALVSGRGAYHSRSRNALWVKGATSGATQELLRVDVDCDHDALRFTVKQAPPGFCHANTRTCWGPSTGLQALVETLAARVNDAPAGSYTRRLLGDPVLLGKKLREEAQELSDAKTAENVTHEAADVLYFTLVSMLRAGVSLDDVARELDRRALAITRRAGNAKE